VFGELPALLEEAQAEVRRRESGQFALFGEASGESPGSGKGRERPRPLRGPAGAAHFEKETLGFYITGTRWTRSPGRSRCTQTRPRGAHALKPDAEVRIGGLVTGLKERMTGGEKMATWTLEDLEGTVEVVVFPKPPESRETLEARSRSSSSADSNSRNRGQDPRRRGIPDGERPERLAKSVHFHLLLDRMNPRHPGAAKTILRNSGRRRIHPVEQEMEVHRFREPLPDVLHPEYLVGVDLDPLFLEFESATRKTAPGFQGFPAFRERLGKTTTSDRSLEILQCTRPIFSPRRVIRSLSIPSRDAGSGPRLSVASGRGTPGVCCVPRFPRRTSPSVAVR